MRNPDDLKQKIFDELKRMPVIDAHEHLVPESMRTEREIDIFILFGMYSDMASAGCKDVGTILGGTKESQKLSIEERWRMFEPFYNRIRWGGYSQDAHIFLRDFYGVSRVNESNCREVSERLQAENSPGLYDRILRKKCHIESAIVHPHPGPKMKHTDYSGDLLRPLVWISEYVAELNSVTLRDLASRYRTDITDLDALRAVLRSQLLDWKSEGVVAVKMSSVNLKPSNPPEANAILRELLKGDREETAAEVSEGILEPDALRSELTRYYCELAAEQDLPMAVHAGVWGDFRKLSPTNIIPLIQEHPDTRFDVFHAGVPYVRETAFLGKNFANVTLNLCWCSIFSPTMTRQIIDEYLDMVPINKITAFGGDYIFEVEKVYGHLRLTLEIMADVLAGKIRGNIMDLDEASYVGRHLLYDNPKEIYAV